MKATSEWQEYDHDYEKDFQDIRLKNGREFKNCWPNAGKWNVLSINHPQIMDNQVTHVRLTDEEDMD
jgi:hypothetical protein